MNLRNSILQLAIVSATASSAQLIEGFEAPTGPVALVECANSAIPPWKAFSSMPLNNGNLIRVLQRGASANGFAVQNACAPDSYDEDPSNENYLRFAFKQVNGTGSMGIMREICPAISPACTYDVSLHWTQRTSCGFAPVTMATGAVEVRVGSLIDCEPNLANTTVVLSDPFTVTSTTNDNAFSSWTHPVTTFTPSTPFNRVFIVVRVDFMPANSYSNIFIDDFSFVPQDPSCMICCNPDCPQDLNCDNTIDVEDVTMYTQYFHGKTTAALCDPCHVSLDLDADGLYDLDDLAGVTSMNGLDCGTCCNADCPADFDCDGTVGVSDLLTFIGIYGTYTSTIDDPCLHLIDINNDGIIGVTDELYFIGQYGTSCSSNLSAAPTTDRSLVDRTGHVLTATADPNPGAGQYRIAHQLPGEGAIDITVVDHQGRVVVRRSAADQPMLLLDLQDQQPGTYTAVMVRNGNLSTVLLVKE